MVALGWLINSSIYHVDAQSDVKNLFVMASELGYTQEQLEAMMKEVTEVYGKDRGKELINATILGS
ncbi:MAG TPA: hypothetical protein VLB04_03335 [Methanotrichaceae archaeon]|nr:hypothetical protein [Methanotrichaceae archaeon]